ncbi:MAG: hypothetical protein ACK553_15340 [Planctomycetota bacterium]|jgi:hypothetical protein
MKSPTLRKPQLRAWIRSGCLAAATVSLVLPSGTGCNRAHYRTRADQEVGVLISEKIRDACAPEIRSIQIDPASRMFDPFNPDRPPMPEDDGVAAQYMRVLNGKKHYPLWDVNGRTNTAENPIWWQYLPLDERGVLVIDSDMAVRLATLHNPNYQAEIETLYLSALDVSTERFRFSNQLFGGYSNFYTANGSLRGSSTISSNLFTAGIPPRGVGLRRRFTTGADLIVGMANNITWSLTGPTTESASSLVDFTFIQPLLRNGGRDVVLETLTLAERTLLYNVRAFERYRTGFYVTVTVGRQAEPGPSRRGGLLGGAGLQGFSGLGGGFGAVGNTLGGVGGGFGGAGGATGGGAGGGFAGGGAVGGVGGFMGLVQNLVQIRNAEENVARLRENLARFEDTLREQLTIIPPTQDTIPSQQLQVAQARQALISSQAALLQQKFNLEQSLDNFKVNVLGLPPYVCIEIKDPILDQFDLISTELKDRRNQVADLRDRIGNTNYGLLEMSPVTTDAATGGKARRLEWNQQSQDAVRRIESDLGQLEQLGQTILGKDINDVRSDIERLVGVLPRRERELQRLRAIYLQERNTLCSLLPTDTLDLALLDSTGMDQLPKNLGQELDKLEERFRDRETRLRQLRNDARAIVNDPQQIDGKERFLKLRDNVVLPSQGILAEYAEDVLALQVVQAKSRIESVVLPEVDILPEEAVEIARINRLDWMNARASLVDAWRSIEFVADRLESSLDLVFSGDLVNSSSNPFEYKRGSGRLRAGFQWDTPLTRLEERNNYRSVLIDFQQAKRNYYRYEDQVWQTLRSELRNLRYNQYNFELQRYAVRIAAQQITINEDLRLVRESLNQASGPTAARDSVSALSDLLNAQNNFLNVWVFYEAQRRNLDQDLGTIRVDAENIWIDPGPITSGIYGSAGQDGAGMQCGPCLENGAVDPGMTFDPAAGQP